MTTTARKIAATITETLTAQLGGEIEVTVAKSTARGAFISLYGAEDILDAAESLMAQCGRVRQDRDEEEEDALGMFCDFYSL